MSGLLCLAALDGCLAQRPGGPDRAAAMAQWTLDSAKYVQDSVKWVRDSVVLDSISRTINTDSLYRLYRRTLYSTTPVPLVFAEMCETERLFDRYGSIPGGQAIRRMQDTLWRPTETADVARMDAQIHSMSVAEMMSLSTDRRKCGYQNEPRAPDSLNGTLLRTTNGRPIPPKKPR